MRLCVFSFTVMPDPNRVGKNRGARFGVTSVLRRYEDADLTKNHSAENLCDCIV